MPRLNYPKLLLVGLAAFASLAPTGAAFAQAPTPLPPSAERVRSGMFDASDPAGLVRFMEKTGYHAQLATDQQGDPIIKGRISHSDYYIQFYECEKGAFCNSVQFLAQAQRPPALTLDQINAFNSRWRYVRLTLADNQVRMQMDVNLDAGVTGDNLEDTLDIWRQLLETFEREVLKLS